MAKGTKTKKILIVAAVIITAGIVAILIYKTRKNNLVTPVAAASSLVTAGYSPEKFPLEKGMSGEKVRALQGGLEILGYSVGKWGVDGKFGNDTLSAVRAFFQNPNKTQVTEAEWQILYDVYSDPLRKTQ